MNSPLLPRDQTLPKLHSTHHRVQHRSEIMTDAPDRILRIKAVLALTGLSRSTLYRKVEQGRFPKQINIAERCVGWRQSAVREWMQNPARYLAG